MKKVEAVIQLSDVDEVRSGLAKIGIRMMTVTEVKTFGKQGHVEYYKGRKYEPPFLAEAKLDLVVSDETADHVVAVIRATSHADEPWNARILVLPLDDIAASQMGKQAIAAA
jgi:nitrogen regulatory protein P-II 1